MTENSENEKRVVYKSFLICSLLSFVFAFLTNFLSVICIKNFERGFINDNSLLFSILSTLICVLGFVFSLVFWYRNKKTVTRIIISSFAFFIFIISIMIVLQKTGFFYILKDGESFKSYLEEKGSWMPVVYILLQYLQVVILPIPGFVSTAAGVALFGPFKTLIYSFIGIVLGSITAFYIGRFFGYKVVAWIVGENDLKKWLNKIKGKDNFVLTAMFVLPLFPDDILCFVAGLSSMSQYYFIIMIIISRVFSITATCYSVNFIPFNTWWGITIWGAIIGLIIALFVLLYKNIDNINEWFIKKIKKN